MKKEEARDIVELIRAAAVPAHWDDRLTVEVGKHLGPLPYFWALKNAQRWAVTPKVDARGQEIPKYLTTLPEVLVAVGVPPGALDDLIKATNSPGSVLIPNLRNLNTLTLVGPDDPIPQGCYEYLVENKIPVPRNRAIAPVDYQAEYRQQQAALKSGDAKGPMSREEALAFIRKVTGNDQRALAVRSHSDVVEIRDLEEMLERHPDVPEVFAGAIKRLLYRLQGQLTALEDQRLMLEERTADLEQVADGEAPLEGLIEAVSHLMARVRSEHPQMTPFVIERVLGALIPELSQVSVGFSRRDALDPSSEILRALIDCRRPTVAKPTKPVKATKPEPRTDGPKSLGSLLKARS